MAKFVEQAEDAVIAVSNYRLHIKFKESLVNVSGRGLWAVGEGGGVLGNCPLYIGSEFISETSVDHRQVVSRFQMERGRRLLRCHLLVMQLASVAALNQFLTK